MANIAGVLNEHRNVLGMMPHPERASAALLGGEDGNAIWESRTRTHRGGPGGLSAAPSEAHPEGGAS